MIRFNINRKDGFWDPYSAYFDVEISFDNADNGVMQLDGSSHSLISQLQISSKGSLIEKIDDYDSLMHFLMDMQYTTESRDSRIQEGVGSKLFTNNFSWEGTKNGVSVFS